jgi:serine/threonine-protein kinase mTOR
VKNTVSTDVALVLNTTGPSSEEYYQTVVIGALLNVLKDPSLSSSHHAVIEAIMAIFKTQGLKCVSFLPQVRLEYDVCGASGK